MTPIIRQLQSNFFNLPSLEARKSDDFFQSPSLEEQKPLHWIFDEQIKNKGPEFYSKLVDIHPILNLEYSIYCNQLRESFARTKRITKEKLIEQMHIALMLAQLLEQLHQHYLIVPREVDRLRKHQAIYRSLLSRWAGYTFTTPLVIKKDTVFSPTLWIRDNTAWGNWFRLLFTRGKRLLDSFAALEQVSKQYIDAIKFLHQYLGPFFNYLSWCFFIPRFATNLFLLLKHTIPGSWMGQKEKDLGSWVRFKAQIIRRWFELGNDLVWIAIGLFNCFLFIGALAPIGIYFNLAAFAFDIANTGFRAAIELERLFALQKEYQNLDSDESCEDKNSEKNYQKYIHDRIYFEQLRLGLSVGNAIAVCLVMGMTALTFHAVIPLVAAILLVAIWFISFTLTKAMETYRPNDAIEKPSNVNKWRFFTSKEAKVSEETPEIDPEMNLICT